MIWDWADIIIRNKVHNKCNAFESSWNQPHPLNLCPGWWKNCLPWNRYLEPKMLGTAALCYLTQCWNPWRHFLKILGLFIWRATKELSIVATSNNWNLKYWVWTTEWGYWVANTFESSSCQHSLYKQILPSQDDHFRVYLLKFSENNFRELVGQNRK